MSERVHPDLIVMFNGAVQAARFGDHGRALALYQAAAGRTHDDATLPASGDFVATARMRAAFCLMDLERNEEALAELELAMTLVHELDTAGRYELFLAYGNTLGRLGKLDACFAALVEAIGHAEDLDDYTGRPANCWSCILMHAARLEAWTFLQEKSAIALNNARLRGMTDLADVAARFAALARQHLQAPRA